MTRARELLGSFGRFWWDFVVGDDWTTAAGVLVALGATYGLVRGNARPAWWLLPLAAVAIVAVGVRRADRRDEDRTQTTEGSGDDSSEPTRT
jgi:hypothetical protein